LLQTGSGSHRRNQLRWRDQNVGGNRLFLGEQSYDVRGIGLLGSEGNAVQDIQSSVVNEQKGTAVHVGDVADVDVGHAPRLGIVGFNDEADVVQGIVLMRYGGETPTTLEGIYKHVEYIRQNHILPPGMDIEPYYSLILAVLTRVVQPSLLVVAHTWLERRSGNNGGPTPPFHEDDLVG
jgi:heavy metal efflux system protein